jgi:hypothetical protein
MWLVKLLLAIAIFITALSVFVMSPERQTKVREMLGIGRNHRALVALSILGMVFGTVLWVRTVLQEIVMRNGSALCPHVLTLKGRNERSASVFSRQEERECQHPHEGSHER